MSLSPSPVSQTSVTGVCHSTFEFLLIGSSSQSIVVGLLRFWDSLKFKKESEFMVNFVIHGFIPAGCANHYMPSLKAIITSAPEINLQS
ncbi:hypothetical protein Bca4012_009858 [Brassica carinata]